MQTILSNAGNFTQGRNGFKVIRGYFHRTAVKGDTAVGEANYFHNHCVKASAYVFIDLAGVVVVSVPEASIAWAVDEWDENEISCSIEFTGLNGTPLTNLQIAAAIQLIRGDAVLKTIANHRLAIAEITPRKVSGWGNHKDVTTAYNIAGGHQDAISETEIGAILRGVYA